MIPVARKVWQPICVSIPAVFALRFQDNHPSLFGRQRRITTPYLGENTTRRGHSLAGYQLLWKALPIARSEETTVTAK